jgi:polyadenylate-binding protein
MLGNKLYPLVEQIEPVQARKVTGMLLEMGKLEILHLLESQEALQAKVLEAVVVLQRSEARGSPNPASSAVSTPTMDA